MSFGVYFELILTRKWLEYMLAPPEKILKMWCCLVRFDVYFYPIVYWKKSLKLTYVHIKQIYILKLIII